MAYAVLAAVERRTGAERSPIGGNYLRPWEDCAIAEVAVTEATTAPLAMLPAGPRTSTPHGSSAPTATKGHVFISDGMTV